MADRAGVFRNLTHNVPDVHWWIVLRGTLTGPTAYTGRRVVFAQCGSACWPCGLPASNLRWCPVCFPGRQALLRQVG